MLLFLSYIYSLTLDSGNHWWMRLYKKIGVKHYSCSNHNENYNCFKNESGMSGLRSLVGSYYSFPRGFVPHLYRHWFMKCLTSL